MGLKTQPRWGGVSRVGGGGHNPVGVGGSWWARSQGRPSFLRPTLGWRTESRWDKANPIGVAVYELQSKLPGKLKGKLPTAKQLADVVRVEMEEGK